VEITFHNAWTPGAQIHLAANTGGNVVLGGSSQVLSDPTQQFTLLCMGSEGNLWISGDLEGLGSEALWPTLTTNTQG
jgi:hypothetical protein